MLRPATFGDLPEIVSLLQRANATPYDIARVAEEKVFGRGVLGEPQVRVVEAPSLRAGGDAGWKPAPHGGKIIGISVTCGRVLRLIAVDPEYRRRGIGSQLLDGQVAFAEAGNYFTPGVIESDTATRAFFAKHGFIEERWTSNLETTQLPEKVSPEVQRVSEATRARVLAFVEQHFGAAWRFECENAGPRLFFIEDNGEIAGFSAHDANNRGLGFFGPTGVAESARGRGFGTLLLRASLADLHAMGYARAVIPWTDAIEFYAKACAARVTHRFVTMSLR
jgi:GNAT superfamily N-acetyltransferase